jgi:hypothetical protein
VRELLDGRNISSTEQLFELQASDWIDIVKKTGAPAFIEGQSDDDKAKAYAELIERTLNAAFPTRRTAGMIEKDPLPIEKTITAKNIDTFLSANKDFDFATSRVMDFDKKIHEVAGDNYAEVKHELMKLQRVFQVSTTPEVMTALLKNNLHSAYTIANIPRKSFIRTYGGQLQGRVGGDAHNRVLAWLHPGVRDGYFRTGRGHGCAAKSHSQLHGTLWQSRFM